MAVLPLVAALLLHVSVAPDQWDVDYKYGQRDYELLQQDPHCDWKCMLFTLQWPGTFCQVSPPQTHKLPHDLEHRHYFTKTLEQGLEQVLEQRQQPKRFTSVHSVSKALWC